MTRVCIISLWHLGLVHVAGFAHTGVQVVGLDVNNDIIKKLRKGILPIYEPGLKEGLQNQRIIFSSNVRDVGSADFIIIAYDTLVAENGDVNITPIFDAAKRIAPFIAPETPVIITSQVPLGTSKQIDQMIHSQNPLWKSGVVYVPENIKLGEALERFKTPDMLIFGSDHPVALQKALKLYAKIYTKKIVLTLKEAEMVKHAINAFLATAISFGNEIAELCDKLDVDAMNVLSAVQKDNRINRAPILPGLGFSGATLLRDVVQLLEYAKKNRQELGLLRSVFSVNKGTFSHVRNLVNRALGDLGGKTIGFLGLTYKEGTSTMRHSPAVMLAREFVSQGGRCLAYDPTAEELDVDGRRKLITRVSSPRDLAKHSDVLLLVTPWPEFRALQYTRLARLMKKPMLIDAKNFLDPVKVKRAGFTYIGYGR